MNSTRIMIDQLSKLVDKQDKEPALVFYKAYQDEEFYRLLNSFVIFLLKESILEGADLPGSLVMAGFLLGCRYKEISVVETLLTKED